MHKFTLAKEYEDTHALVLHKRVSGQVYLFCETHANEICEFDYFGMTIPEESCVFDLLGSKIIPSRTVPPEEDPNA